MRDLNALRTRLFVALALGLGGCHDGESSEAEANKTGDEAKAASETKKTSESEEVTKPDEGKGVGQMVAEIKAEADAKAEAEANRPKVDPVVHCGSVELTVTVKDAKDNRMHPEDTLGCPYSTEPVGVAGMARFALDEYATQALRDAGDTEHCCYRIDRPKRGRPLVESGALVLPDFELGPRMAEGRSRRAAAAWLRDARMEWASVTSFERAAAELAGLGAPASLIERCLDAAEDERRHTAHCLALAERVSGRRIRLSRLPELGPRPGGLRECLQRTFSEGCVAETAAAVVAQRAARRAEGDIAAILREIADDEAEHAALAWTTIGWGWGRLSAREREEFLAWARDQCPMAVAPGPDPDARLGCLSPATEQAIAGEAWVGAIEPMLDVLARTDSRVPIEARI